MSREEAAEKVRNGKAVVIDMPRLLAGIIILIVGIVLSQVIIASSWKGTINEKVSTHVGDEQIHQTYESKTLMFIPRKELNVHIKQWDRALKQLDEIHTFMNKLEK